MPDSHKRTDLSVPDTPMMAQYREAKAAYPDCLLFFRMGDFYELFFADAEAAAAALDIALTRRGDVPMAGVPWHAHEGYLARLIRRGFKVAICDQVESPAEARKRGGRTLVERRVVRVVTPGTITEDGLLEARASNYLAALARTGGAERGRFGRAPFPSGRPDNANDGLGAHATLVREKSAGAVPVTDGREPRFRTPTSLTP